MGRQRQRQRERRKRLQQQQQLDGEQTRPRPSGPKRGAAPPPRQGISRGPIIAGIAIVIIVLLFVGYQVLHSQNSATPNVQLTVTPQTQGVRKVDGIGCLGNEQLAYHIHQHLTIYNHGVALKMPALIGIPTKVVSGRLYAKCYYWIHVHDNTGIIHVESPTKRTYTFGDFLDIWAATKRTTIPPQVALIDRIQHAGPSAITAFYNGKKWTGNYRSMPLKVHSVITLEVGKPIIPPKPFTNWQGE